MDSKWHAWFQILTVTITVYDNGLTSLKSFYSSVKWEWWYSNHKYLIDPAYKPKKIRWEHLARITFLTYYGSCALFHPFALIHFLLCLSFPPWFLLASFFHTRKSHHMWYIKITKEKQNLSKSCHILVSDLLNRCWDLSPEKYSTI